MKQKKLLTSLSLAVSVLTLATACSQKKADVDNPTTEEATEVILTPMEAILQGDFTSISGTWTNAKGESIDIDPGGSDLAKEGAYIIGIQEVDYYLKGQYRYDQYSSAFFYVPAGEVMPDVEGETDTSRDRIAIAQAVPTPEDIYYRAE